MTAVVKWMAASIVQRRPQYVLKNNRENVSKDIKVLLNDSGIANTNNNGNNTSQMRLLNF
jgi:hypothetical protein